MQVQVPVQQTLPDRPGTEELVPSIQALHLDLVLGRRLMAEVLNLATPPSG